MPDRTGRADGIFDLPNRRGLWLGLVIATLGPFAITPIARMAAVSRFAEVAYVLVVMAATLVGRLIAASVAIALSVGLLDYYFIGPVGQFGTSSSADVWAVVSFVLIALVVAQLLVWRDRAVRSANAERERLAFLTRAGDTLVASLDYGSTLKELADVLVPTIADWYSVDLLEDGVIRNVAVWHEDPQKLRLARDLQERLPRDVDAPTGAPNVIRTGEPELTETISDELLEQLVPDAEVLRIVRGLGLRCAMVVPLTARGRTFGAVTLVGAETHERYTESDLRLAEAITDRAALAIDNARLFRAEAEAREEATDEARRNELLKDVTAAFGRTSTIDQVVASMLEVGLEAAGARRGVIGVLSEDDSRVDVLGTRGYQQRVASYWQGFPVDGPYPLARAIRERRPIVLSSTDERDREYPALAGEGQEEDHALVCLPLRLGERVVGGFSASFPPGFTFDEARLSFLLSVGEQCAQALERARSRERERRTRRHFDELATISRRLAATLDHDATVATVVRLALEHLGTRAALYLVHNDSIALVAEGRFDAEGNPVVDAFPSSDEHGDAPVDVRVAIETKQERLIDDPDAADDAAGSASGIVLPLSIAGTSFGAIAVSDPKPERDYAQQDELAFCAEVARRMARAMENARLYRERDYIARTLQKSLLPPGLPDVPSIDAEALFLPAFRRFEIGGDFYDLFETPSGRWAAVIGDVCGKGVDAAVLTGLARHTLRAAAGAERPSDALRALNAALLREDLDGKFCTVCFVLIDPNPADGPRLTVACGGHPLPQLLSADGGHRSVGRHGTLLGVTEEPRLTDVEVHLAPGSALVMYTDGLLRKEEAFADEPLQLARALGRDAPRSAADVKARIERYVEDLISEEQDDDIAVLVLRAR